MTVAPVEYGGRSVVEFFGIVDGLGHSRAQVKALHPLALDMHPWEAGQVRGVSVTHCLPRLHGVATTLEDGGKLQFPGTAFSL